MIGRYETCAAGKRGRMKYAIQEINRRVQKKIYGEREEKWKMNLSMRMTLLELW
jgi:hypothetical protein